MEGAVSHCVMLENDLRMLTENADNTHYCLTNCNLQDLLCLVSYICVYLCINQRTAYGLFHWDFILAQDSNLFMDERILCLCPWPNRPAESPRASGSHQAPPVSGGVALTCAGLMEWLACLQHTAKLFKMARTQ